MGLELIPVNLDGERVDVEGPCLFYGMVDIKTEPLAVVVTPTKMNKSVSEAVRDVYKSRGLRIPKPVTIGVDETMSVGGHSGEIPEQQPEGS